MVKDSTKDILKPTIIHMRIFTGRKFPLEVLFKCRCNEFFIVTIINLNWVCTVEFRQENGLGRNNS